MERKLGNINIDKNVIAQITHQSVLGCYGVVGFGYKSKGSNIAELLKGDSATTKGVKVELDGDKLSIEVYIVVQYGTNIAAVSTNIIETTRYNVENMTDLKVSKINVNVQGVRTV